MSTCGRTRDRVPRAGLWVMQLDCPGGPAHFIHSAETRASVQNFYWGSRSWFASSYLSVRSGEGCRLFEVSGTRRRLSISRCRRFLRIRRPCPPSSDHRISQTGRQYQWLGPLEAKPLTNCTYSGRFWLIYTDVW